MTRTIDTLLHLEAEGELELRWRKLWRFEDDVGQTAFTAGLRIMEVVDQERSDAGDFYMVPVGSLIPIAHSPRVQLERHRHYARTEFSEALRWWRQSLSGESLRAIAVTEWETGPEGGDAT